MNPSPEPQLRQVLQALADVPGPADLTDGALRHARARRRRRGAAIGVGAIAMIGVLATPFLLKPSTASPPFGANLTASSPTARPSVNIPGSPIPTPSVDGYFGNCVHAPSVPERKEVAQENWPAFVRTVIGKLPARNDYLVQNAYDLCKPGEATVANAYAVINLGAGRQYGSIGVKLYRGVPTAPVTCADVANWAQPQSGSAEVLFCEKATAGTPLVFAVRVLTSTIVSAVYPDKRMVSMESHPDPVGHTYSVSPTQLLVVATDPGLAALLV